MNEGSGALDSAFSRYKSVTARKIIRKKLLAAHRKLREFRMIAKGLASTRHPLLVHIIPTRRCNLACTYCNEYDDFSKPVPTEEMFRRIDRLGAMGTAVVTISGGEPLLHPELDAIIARIRHNGIMAGTDHQRLSAHRRSHRKAQSRRASNTCRSALITRKPDDVSKKSLKVLDQKLKLLPSTPSFR